MGATVKGQPSHGGDCKGQPSHGGDCKAVMHQVMGATVKPKCHGGNCKAVMQVFSTCE